MSDLLSKLIELIMSCWQSLILWVIVPQEEIGFIRRFGKARRALHPGWNWKLSFLEKAELINGQEGVYVLSPQSLRTTDNVDIVIQATVTFQIFDSTKFHVNAWGAGDNLRDLVAGEIGEAILDATSEEVWNRDALKLALKRARVTSKRWGINIIKIRCKDATKASSLRLWNTNTTHQEVD